MSDPQLYHPRYWPTWIFLGLLRALLVLPYRLQIKIGELFGALLFKLSPKRSKAAMITLQFCYPEMSENQLKIINHAHFLSTGVALVEMAMSWWGDEKRLAAMMEIEGVEHLNLALNRGKGIILLGGHYTTMEIAGRLFSLVHPLQVTYKDEGNAVFSSILRISREKHFERHIAIENVRDVVRGLQNNRVVWLAPDQNYRRKNMVFADFFGVAAATNPGPARFVSITEASVLPFRVIRDSVKAKYKLVILPPVENIPTDSLESDCSQINQAMERMIRLAPDQYMWALKRFRTRPGGNENPYRK